MTTKETRIFIIDDDPSLREALSLLLRSAGYRFEAFASAEEFLGRRPYCGIGCIVLDVRMSGMSGLDLQEELVRKGRCMPIIFITGHGDIPMTVQAMKSGAADFLPKPFDDDQLLGAIQGAIERHQEEQLKHDETDSIRRRIETLTPRENEVFRYAITGLLNKQVAAELKIAEQTVKIHRSRIMQKLGASSVADLVRMAEKINIGCP
jgi:FixJ family two-component response regulator